MGRRAAPPQEITLVYRPVGKSHVFTSPSSEMAGFHISHPSLKFAFNLAGYALGKHISELYQCSAVYEIEGSFEEFQGHLKGESLRTNLITAHLSTRREGEIRRIN